MIKTYEEFFSLIKEGLIRTHNIIDNQDILDIHFGSANLEFDLKIKNKFDFTIEFFNIDKIKQHVLDGILPIINNLGYFPSYIWVTNIKGMINSFKFDEKYISNSYKNIKIRFESKYDESGYKNDLQVPSVAYHLTKKRFKEKIIKNGLCPRSLNRKTIHLDRIYMFKYLIQYSDLLKSLKITDVYDEEYILLEIKLSDKNIIHTDPNYADGFYTTDNIPFSDIKIIKENL